MQVKMFRSRSNGILDLESDINKWLKQNPNVMTMNWKMSKVVDEDEIVTTILVTYTDMPQTFHAPNGVFPPEFYDKLSDEELQAEEARGQALVDAVIDAHRRRHDVEIGG